MSDDYGTVPITIKQTQAKEPAMGKGGLSNVRRTVEKRYTGGMAGGGGGGSAGGGGGESAAGEVGAEGQAVSAGGKSLKRGTPKVRKTGMYKLHSGEAVLNRRQASKYRRSRLKRSSK